VKWVPLAEWWYNTNFHTSIQLTPFEALYGYPLPQLSLGVIPRSSNQAVNEVLADRQSTLKVLKQHLTKAQERMKRYADRKRTERKFQLGDWVYLKLQPYRQVSIQGKTGTHKLKPKYYGPFEIFKKIGAVAYKLNLPPGSVIHPVFHVSQLKKCHGHKGDTSGTLPVIGTGDRVRIEPIEILDRRLVKRNNTAATEILVKWSNLSDEDSTWEDYEFLCKQSPQFKLEDKLKEKGAVLLGMIPVELEQDRLVTVEQLY
jgi:Chromo (CHRromatin Organisation MOdifier) domain